MAREPFVDTSGFYALLARRDDRHVAASRLLDQAAGARERFVTTDYVLDETATLLKARGHHHLLTSLFSTVMGSTACRVEWTDSQRFDRATRFFLKHLDQAWSFTDCVSFCVMRELRVDEALSKDVHFQEAGFTALLAGHQ